MLKRHKKDRYVTSADDSKMLALFWYAEDNFVGLEDSITGPSSVQFGNYYRIDCTHDTIWNNYKNQTAHPEKSWTYYPRGEVLYNSILKQFIVRADRSISEDTVVQRKVLFKYGLPDNTRFETDWSYSPDKED